MKEAVPFPCSKLMPVNRCWAQAQYVCLTRKGIQVVAAVRNFIIGLKPQLLRVSPECGRAVYRKSLDLVVALLPIIYNLISYYFSTCWRKPCSCKYFRINVKPPGVGQICTSSHTVGSYDRGWLFPILFGEPQKWQHTIHRKFSEFLLPGVILDSQSFGSSSIDD